MTAWFGILMVVIGGVMIFGPPEAVYVASGMAICLGVVMAGAGARGLWKTRRR